MIGLFRFATAYSWVQCARSTEAADGAVEMPNLSLYELSVCWNIALQKKIGCLAKNNHNDNLLLRHLQLCKHLGRKSGLPKTDLWKSDCNRQWADVLRCVVGWRCLISEDRWLYSDSISLWRRLCRWRCVDISICLEPSSVFYRIAYRIDINICFTELKWLSNKCAMCLSASEILLRSLYIVNFVPRAQFRS